MERFYIFLFLVVKFVDKNNVTVAIYLGRVLIQTLTVIMVPPLTLAG
jgi:hypothetical protein